MVQQTDADTPMRNRSDQRRPLVVAVIGGVASGKSLATRLLGQWGARTIDADRMARQVLDDPAIARRLRDCFGPAVVDSRGVVDRKRLAELVFGDSPEAVGNRRKLESLVHPRVRQRIAEELERAADSGESLIVLDVPLLLEVGWKDLADELLFIDAADSVRRRRAEARGWSADQWHKREASQWPVDRKKRVADAILDNSGSECDFERRLRKWWEKKTAIPPLRGPSDPP